MGIPSCRALTIARAAGQEAGALAEHLLLYPSGISPERWPLAAPVCAHAASAVPHTPVLLLHGLFDNRAVFSRMRRSLNSHGWEHLHALNYNPVTVDLREAAALFGRHVLHTREVYGGERVAVVGHSLGGLIARYYVQRLGGDEHVHTLVTLATPHEGTWGAHLLHPLPISRQLLPGSSVFQELSAPAVGCTTRFVVFRGEHDPLILPQRSSELRHPDLWAENVVVLGSGHVTLPVHRTVITQVREVLTEPQVSTADGQIRLTA
jgi:hypothetical protein